MDTGSIPRVAEAGGGVATAGVSVFAKSAKVCRGFVDCPANSANVVWGMGERMT